MTKTELKKWQKACRALAAAKKAVDDLGIGGEIKLTEQFEKDLSQTPWLDDMGFHPHVTLTIRKVTTGDFEREVRLAMNPLSFLGNTLGWMADSASAVIEKEVGPF